MFTSLREFKRQRQQFLRDATNMKNKEFILFAIISIAFILIFFPPLFIVKANRIWSTGIELATSTSNVEWDTTVGGLTVTTTQARSGNYDFLASTTVSQAQFIRHQFQSDNIVDIFVRTYIYLNSPPSATTSTKIISYCDSTLFCGANVALNSNRTVSVKNQLNVVQSSSTLTIPLATWTRLEMAYYDTQATNTLAIYIDGTLATATSTTDIGGGGIVEIGAVSTSSMSAYFDDIAVNASSTGNNQNTIPGSGKIIHLRPNATGDYDTGIKIGAATAWQATNEVTPNGSTSYFMVTSTVNGGASVNLDPAASGTIVTGDTINLVQVGSYVNASTSASDNFTLKLESQANGTTASSSPVTLAVTTWNPHDDTAPKVYKITSYTNPQAGGGWTPALLDTAQIAFTSSTDAVPYPGVSTLWLLVDYTPTTTISGNTFTPRIILTGKSIFSGEMILAP